MSGAPFDPKPADLGPLDLAEFAVKDAPDAALVIPASPPPGRPVERHAFLGLRPLSPATQAQCPPAPIPTPAGAVRQALEQTNALLGLHHLRLQAILSRVHGMPIDAAIPAPAGTAQPAGLMDALKAQLDLAAALTPLLTSLETYL